MRLAHRGWCGWHTVCAAFDTFRKARAIRNIRTMSVNAEIATGASATGRTRDLFGHPRGLTYIVFTETWERFSYYGMQALLILYMADHLLKPGAIEGVAGFQAFRTAMESVTGPLSTEALATQVFGLYGGLTYLTPIIGGIIGDSAFGRRRAVALGAIVMMIGHFLMASEAMFLGALACLLIGCGLLKGNLATQLGQLYARDDQRADSGFSLYYIGINIGAFIAPLVCGTLGEVYGWHWGFGAAGVGMGVGLAIYLVGLPHMPADAKAGDPTARKLQPGDGLALVGLAVMLLVATLFWTAITQVWNTYSLWVRDYVDREFFGLDIPITWFQSLNSLFVLVMAPPVMLLWRSQAAHKAEPIDLTKIAIGCAVSAISLWMIAASNVVSPAQVSVAWPLAFAVVSAVGYVYAAPVAIALFSRASPAALTGVMIAIYYVSLFLGSTISGFLGRYYATLSPAGFWVLHGAIVAAGALITLILSRPLRRALRL